MRRLLPALLFIFVAAPSAYADSIVTYTVGEQFTKQTPIEEDISWSFTVPQTFTLFDVLAPASADRLDPSEKPGEWLYLLTTQAEGQGPSTTIGKGPRLNS
jgi:hypothetical protein